MVSQRNRQQQSTAECYLANLDFQTCFALSYDKLCYFRLIWSIRDQLYLEFELLSLDFDVFIEGVNCRMRVPSLCKLPSLKYTNGFFIKYYLQDFLEIQLG